MRNTPPRTLRFTDEEIHKFLGGMPAGDFRDMLVFGLVTGLRPPELRGLKKGEVCQAPDGKSYVLIEIHKTSKSCRNPLPRTVPLPAEAVAIVRRQMDRHPKADHIFLTEDATP